MSAGAWLLAAGALLLLAAGALLLAAGALLPAAGALLLVAGALGASGVAAAAGAAAGASGVGVGASGFGVRASGFGAELVIDSGADAAAAPSEGEPVEAARAGVEVCAVDVLVSRTGTVLAEVGVEREAGARSTAVLTAAALAIFVPHARPDECWPSRLLMSDSIREPAPIAPGG